MLADRSTAYICGSTFTGKANRLHMVRAALPTRRIQADPTAGVALIGA